MKNIIQKTTLMMCALFICLPALADSLNQNRAKEMAVVLQSPEVQSLLSQENGIGNLKGIRHLFLNKALFGPSVYELEFKLNSISNPQICKTSVHLNIQTIEVMQIDTAECKKIE
jgi:hypothetical protein